MKFTHTLTSNWENAFRGLRHPLESYARSDSEFGICPPNMQLSDNAIVINEDKGCKEYVILGEKDLDLAQRMIKAGTPNDKYLRQIFVSVDVTAPLYMWKELDTYKVGTTANSTSTMHKLASTPITMDCFEMDDYDYTVESEQIEMSFYYISKIWEQLINNCEYLRQRYNETKDVRYWKELIRILPESWLQTRTWTANYSILRNIYHWRRNHKLTEWHQFCDWINTLPYAEELIIYNN